MIQLKYKNEAIKFMLKINKRQVSYRGVNESEYKKGLIIFYEQNNLTYFKKIFQAQFKFVVDNYF